MKSSASFINILRVSIFAAIVNCAARPTRNLIPRQYSADQIGKATVHSVETLTPKTNNKEAIRKKIRFGPYVVPGSQEPSVGVLSDANDKFGALAINEKIESLCGSDCSILWGVGIPEFENGTAISAVGGSIYNHHVFALNQDRMVSPHICPGDKGPSMKAADAVINSQTDKEVSNYMFANLKSGYALKSTDKLALLAEFMNYRPMKAKINIAFDFEYIPGKPAGYLNAQGIMFSATPCDQIGFNVPSKQYTITSNEWTVPVDLTLINARGHQHDGGVGMQVLVNGKQICNSLPDYVKVSRGNGTELYGIREMSLCEAHAQLKKGDKLTIKSDYDVEKHPQRQSNGGYMEMVAAMLSVVLGLPPDFDVSSL